MSGCCMTLTQRLAIASRSAACMPKYHYIQTEEVSVSFMQHQTTAYESTSVDSSEN
jgi:hypothetical protein